MNALEEDSSADGKYLTVEQLIRKVFPDGDVPFVWVFHERSDIFPIVIIEKECLLNHTDSKEEEKRQLGARDGVNCLHIVHLYYGNSVESTVYQGAQIARGTTNVSMPSFQRHFHHIE